MRRSLPITLIALAVGVALGASVVFAWQDRQPTAAAPAAPPGTAVSIHPLAPILGQQAPTEPFPSKSARPPADSVTLGWSRDALPAGVGARLEQQTGRPATEVQHGYTGVDPNAGAPKASGPAGPLVPIDTIGIDPRTYLAFVSPGVAPAIDGLSDGEAVLSERGARLRRQSRGSTLSLRPLAGGPATALRLSVAAVVPDTALGGSEVAVTTTTAVALGVREVRYVLVAGGDQVDVPSIVERNLPQPARVRLSGETPFLRDGDGVLPLALVKERFGELSYEQSGGTIIIDPAWERQNIVTEDVPILGRLRCHRALVPVLRAAMQRLEQENLGFLVDSGAFGGCYDPKTIRGSNELSRTSWGIAITVNWTQNQTGQGSAQDPRLIEIMRQAGFVWGGDWLVREPSYFEYAGPTPA